MNGLPCPNCGSEVSFLEQYHRHYCYSCGRYAPEGYGDGGAVKCPTCSGVLSYIEAYERYYCYRCNAYPPEQAVVAKPKEPEPEAPQATAPVAEPAIEPVIEPVTEPMQEPSTEPLPAPAAAAEPAPAVVPEEAPAETPTKTPDATPTATPATTSIMILKPSKREKPPVALVEARREPPPRREEPVREETSEDVTEPFPKPTLNREVILQAKKPVLLDLCKAYDLDPTGTKEQLRERLLSYVDELEAESRPEEEALAEEEAVPEEELAETQEADRVDEEPQPTLVEEPITETVVPEELPHEQAPTTSPSASEPSAATAAPQVVQEPTRATTDAQPESVVVVPQASVVREATRVEHPCPTCGRDLTYISQYNRWYCYSCRAYAPAAKPKNACPNCGATLRWIERYERWWCDSCRRYAPAYLPKPEGAATSTTAGVTVAQAVEAAAIQPAVGVHQHRSPGTGLSLIGLGLMLFILYEVLVDLPAALALDTGIVVAADVSWGMRFFAFVFVAFGAMLAMFAMRDRQ